MTTTPSAIWDARLSDAGTLTATSEATAVELLQDHYPWKRWKSTSTAAQTIDLDLGSAMSIDAIALVNHNLTQAGTWLIYLDDDSATFASPTYDPGTSDIHETTIDADLLSVIQPCAIRILSTPVSARYCRIVLTDASNPDGYLAAGRLVVGLALREYLAKSFSLGYIEEGVTSNSYGGSTYNSDRGVRRSVKIALSHKTEASVITGLLGKYGVTKSAGGAIGRDTMLCPRPAKTALYHLEAGYFSLKRNSAGPLTNAAGDLWNAGMEYEEWR